jgi:hypothetical protein
LIRGRVAIDKPVVTIVQYNGFGDALRAICAPAYSMRQVRQSLVWLCSLPRSRGHRAQRSQAREVVRPDSPTNQRNSKL